VTIKSLIDGKVLQKSFKGNEQLDSVDLSYVNVQYLYNDGIRFY
jgi:translation elongation factor P/translation initiation factor 5A